MATEPQWTAGQLREHFEALREADWRFQEERDRRYAEVALEREKALKIKETGDLAALQLAREIQTYKDEKANELREQIGRERGLYATKDDVAAAVATIAAELRPLREYMTAQRGQREGIGLSTRTIVGVFGLIATILSIVIIAANVLT